MFTEDGTRDGRSWLFFFQELLWEWAQFLPPGIVFWKFYLSRRPFLRCERDCERCIVVQAASCTFGALLLSPAVAEEISAAPSYVQGLRALQDKRCLLAWVARLHVILDVLWLLFSVQEARRVSPETCTLSVPRALERKLATWQLPPLACRVAAFFVAPVLWAAWDRKWNLKVLPDGPRRGAFSRPDLTGGEWGEGGESDADRAAKLAYIRATLDVNVHETERAWVERRKLREPLRKLESTHGAARRELAVLEKNLGVRASPLKNPAETAGAAG